MPPIDGLRAIGVSGSDDPVTFDKGVIPGILNTDTFRNSGNTTFNVTVMGTSLFSGVAQSLVATGGSASDATRVRECLAVLIRELQRKGIISGTYTSA